MGSSKPERIKRAKWLLSNAVFAAMATVNEGIDSVLALFTYNVEYWKTPYKKIFKRRASQRMARN